jgi:hypothetical protein
MYIETCSLLLQKILSKEVFFMSKKYVLNVKVNADFVVQAIDPEFARKT